MSAASFPLATFWRSRSLLAERRAAAPLASRPALGTLPASSSFSRRRRRRILAVAPRASAESPEIPRGDTAGAVMLLKDVRITVGDRDLLVDANLRVEPSETVGLVGANGCGKSTLLRAVAGIRGVDAGDLLVAHRADVGYLEQTAVSGSTRTVAEEARSRMTHIRDAERALADAEASIAASAPNAEVAFLAAQERWEALGGNTVERRVSDVLSGLGFAREAWDRPCAALSGGWQMRVALARLLLSPAGDSADVGVNGGFLLLDEPTNHLDARAKEWLGGWLRSYKGTVLLVSHDEALLERGVDRLVEVRAARLHGFSGNYSKFLVERRERRKVAESAAAKASAKAAKLERFVAKNSARASTAAAARSRARQLEGVREDLEALAEETGGGGDLGDGPGDARRVSLTLPPAPEGAKETLTLTDAAVGYGGGLDPLLTGVNLTVRRGDRLLIVGPNGAGKSTLLRSLGGGLRLAAGTLAHGEGARVGYFSQDLAQELPTEDTPLAHVPRRACGESDGDGTEGEIRPRRARLIGIRREGTSHRTSQRRRESARRPRRVRAPTSERAPPRRGVQSPRRGCCGRADERVAGLGRRRGCGDPQQIIRRRARTHRRGARRERCAQDAHGRGRRAVEERFQPGRRRDGRGGGGDCGEGGGGDATTGADPEKRRPPPPRRKPPRRRGISC